MTTEEEEEEAFDLVSQANQTRKERKQWTLPLSNTCLGWGMSAPT